MPVLTVNDWKLMEGKTHFVDVFHNYSFPLHVTIWYSALHTATMAIDHHLVYRSMLVKVRLLSRFSPGC